MERKKGGGTRNVSGVSLTLRAACARDETRTVQSGVDVELLSFAVRVAFEVFYNGMPDSLARLYSRPLST